MGEQRKTVAIIGCGTSGLAAVKCSLDEGLQPTCFERSDGVGGLWYYRENADRTQIASVYKSTYTNTSKEMTCFSDFPFPKDWPNFLQNSYMKRYFDMYADKFGLKKCIRFSTRVTHLAQSPDYDETGRWIVTAEDENDGSETRYEFDAVMICTGMFSNPHIPEYPGMDEFQGRVLHSHDYRKPDKFEDKRVVVVGIGNSAADAAVDVSHQATQVYLSARRGTWLISRRGYHGLPYDMMLIRRNYAFPYFFLHKRSLKERFELITRSLKPSYDYFATEELVNEELPGCLLNGSVVIRASPVRFSKTGIEFEDGSYEENIDAVIMATGYDFKFPFEVDCPALQTKQGRVPLYKLVFPLGLKHSTLSVNGALKPLGPLLPLSELQARWAARVFKGLSKLPSQTNMETEVKMTDDEMQKMFLPNHRHVDSVPYGVSIASEIGVEPNFWKLFFTDPVLSLRCLFGPFVPYQFRLVGPGKWDGAREAINTVWGRVRVPHKPTRAGGDADASFLGYFLLLGVFVAVVVAAILWM